jgi:hypothetical protein
MKHVETNTRRIKQNGENFVERGKVRQVVGYVGVCKKLVAYRKKCICVKDYEKLGVN